MMSYSKIMAALTIVSYINVTEVSAGVCCCSCWGPSTEQVTEQEAQEADDAHTQEDTQTYTEPGDAAAEIVQEYLVQHEAENKIVMKEVNEAAAAVEALKAEKAQQHRAYINERVTYTSCDSLYDAVDVYRQTFFSHKTQASAFQDFHEDVERSCNKSRKNYMQYVNYVKVLDKFRDFFPNGPTISVPGWYQSNINETMDKLLVLPMESVEAWEFLEIADCFSLWFRNQTLDSIIGHMEWFKENLKSDPAKIYELVFIGKHLMDGTICTVGQAYDFVQALDKLAASKNYNITEIYEFYGLTRTLLKNVRKWDVPMATEIIQNFADMKPRNAAHLVDCDIIERLVRGNYEQWNLDNTLEVYRILCEDDHSITRMKEIQMLEREIRDKYNGTWTLDNTITLLDVLGNFNANTTSTSELRKIFQEICNIAESRDLGWKLQHTIDVYKICYDKRLTSSDVREAKSAGTQQGFMATADLVVMQLRVQ